MKSFFISAALSLSTLSAAHIAAPAAQAQMDAQTANDVQRMGEWASAFNDYNTEVAAIFEGEDFENLFLALQGDDDSAIMTRHATWKVSATSKVNSLKLAAENFPRPPLLQSSEMKSMQSSLQVQYDSVQETTDQVSDMISQIDLIAKQVMSGDYEAVTDVSKILIRSGQRMVRSENVMMQSSAVAIPKDHPNRYLVGTVVDLNNYTIELLNITVLSLDDKETLAERQSVITAMESHIPSARSNIAKARKANDKYLRQFNRALSASSNAQERSTLKTVVVLFESFENSIDTEERQIDIAEQQIGILKRDELYSDIETEIDALDDKTYPLIDDRLRQQGERAQLISQMQ